MEGYTPQVAKGNPAVEEIRDYENNDIREILTSSGIVSDGDAITPEDYQAIRTRAEVLASNADEKKVSISAKALLLGAYADRMKNIGRLAEEDIKNMPYDVVRAIMYARTAKYKPSDEEIDLLRNSPLAVNNEWGDQREKSKMGVADYNVAVDKNETVVGSGGTPEEAVRSAQEGR